MIKTLLLWFFLLINFLTLPAYGSKSTAEIEDFRSLDPRKKPEGHAAMYGMIKESSKPSTQETYQGLHVVQHTETSQKKTVYGGGNNVKSPHKSKSKKSGANTYSIKSSSLFMAAVTHLIPGLLLLGCFF